MKIQITTTTLSTTFEKVNTVGVNMSEIEETQQLIAQATFPGLKSLLGDHLNKLRAAEARAQAAVEARAQAAASEETSTATLSSSKINPSVAPSAAAKRIVPVTGAYIPLENFAWDQGSYNSDTITIYVELDGVGSVKQNCNINFGKSSFDLTVTDLNGKNYRLLNDNLEKDIIPGESKIVIKANKILIKLKKVKGEYSYEHWTNLTAKKKRDAAEEASKKKEPMGGIMDMMKDLYQDGDENMRKVIGEAMLKSSRGEKMEPPSMDGLGDI